LIAHAQNYHVSDHWKIGGEGGWDYLLSDDAAHRLYVTHGARVEVIDTKTGEKIGAITGLKGTHGIALNPDGKTGYISDGGANAIVVFDRATLAVKQNVAAGGNPDGIAFEPVTSTVWAFNGRSHDLSIMSAASNTIDATISLPGKPEFPRADGRGKVFVNIEDKNLIVELDAREKKIVASWPLTGCDSPSGLAIDTAKHRLFSVCGGEKMAISDYKTGKLIALATIGNHPDAAGFDPKTGHAYSSNGDGTLTVIDTRKSDFPVLETVTTVPGARTMTFDAHTGHVFLSTAKYGPTPAPTEAAPRPRPTVLPETFEILVLAR
ncbi:MAG TPA: YncE family protein, partial [Acidobacteriaceae bacterium]|nr:YncE family protein [Acidobacteriaceae bacterium]